jgi:hypothetical protein
VRRLAFLGVLALVACSGPDAPDAAVCQDLIHRLCHAPLCPNVATTFGVSADCDATLLASSGCGEPGFQFTDPSRDRVLSCRAPLLRSGDATTDAPSCSDIDETLACQDVVTMLEGGAP